MTSNQNQIKAILWVLTAHFSLSLFAPISKIISAELNVAVMVFIQSIISLLVVCLFGVISGKFDIKTKRLRFHFLRSICGTSAVAITFFSVSKIPVNQFISITFTTAIFATIFASLFLKEKIGFHRASAVATGFIGTVIILQPSLEFSHIAVFATLFASMLFGILSILFKIMVRTEKIFTIVFYLFLFSIILSSPFAYYFWQTPNLKMMLLIIAIGIIDTIIITSFIKAFSYADISFLAPFEFSKLIFTAVIANIIFSEELNFATIIGSLVIVGSNIYIARREAKIHRHNI